LSRVSTDKTGKRSRRSRCTLRSAANTSKPDEELLEVEKSEAGTVVIKKIPCGKDCGGCPHGPYKYVVSREGDDLNWEYKGRVE
jgi:hypothetical protein